MVTGEEAPEKISSFWFGNNPANLMLAQGDDAHEMALSESKEARNKNRPQAVYSRTVFGETDIYVPQAVYVNGIKCLPEDALKERMAEVQQSKDALKKRIMTETLHDMTDDDDIRNVEDVYVEWARDFLELGDDNPAMYDDIIRDIVVEGTSQEFAFMRFPKLFAAQEVSDE